MVNSGEGQVLYTGKYLQLMRANTWEYTRRVNISGIVGIVAVTDEGELLFVEQYRPPMNKRVIELPAGLAGDTAGTEHEDLAAAARRELIEETGYDSASMTFLCEGPPSAGTTTEIITLFLAEGLSKVGKGGGDDTEDIITYKVPLRDVQSWLDEKRAQGVLIDLRIFTGLYFLKCT